MTMNDTLIKNIYYHIIRIRKFEEKVIEHYGEQQMRCPVHLYIGQEAIAVGVCVQLRKDDYVFSYHRNHGHMLAKGADPKLMFAELYGKRTGCSSGKGGSTHMISSEHTLWGTSAIVGGGIPIAVGAALSIAMKNEDRVVAVFFGDGAVDQGTFFESLNFAVLKKLPVLFLCENNFYATNSPQRVRQANLDIHKIADFFNIPGACIDGNNVFEVYRQAASGIERARQGGGPSFIEARTYRCRTHVGPETDIEKGFRAKEEVEAWMQKCPYKQFKAQLLENRMIDEKDLQAVEKKVDAEIEEAFSFALQGPFPQEEDLYKDVY